MINFSLILPVYNQADIIEPVFEDIYKTLKKCIPSFEIILVENGSRDASWDAVKRIAKKYKNTIAMQSKKGYGTAINAGLKKSKGEFISYMPSDGQVDMKIFPKLWKVAQTKKYDVVKVKRPARENAGRIFVSKFWSYLMFILYQKKIVDINGNPRIVLREKISQLKLTSSDSFIDGEFFIKATFLGWSFFEIPMRYIERAGGESTRKFSTYTEFIYNIFNAKWGERFTKWKQGHAKEKKQTPLQIFISRYFLLILFIVFPLFILFPFLRDPYVHRTNDLDNITFSIQYVKDAILQKHYIPQWNFFANEGIPVWADPLNTLLNPIVFILFILFPLSIFIKLLYSFLLIFSCFSMYYTCRKLGANAFTSLISSLTYVSSGYVISRILLAHFLIISYPVLPILFLSVIELYKKSSLVWSTILALALTWILFSEDLNSLLYGSIILGSVLVFALVQRKDIRGFLGSGFLFFSFSAVRILPIIQLSSILGKIQEPFAGSQNPISILYYMFFPVKPLFQFLHISQFITPDFAWWEKIAYIGVAPLFFIFLLFVKKINIQNRFLYFYIFFILFLISIPSFSLNPYHYAILSFQALQNFHVPSRVFNYICAFSLIITAITATTLLQENISYTKKNFAIFFLLLNLFSTVIFFEGVEIKKPMPIVDPHYSTILVDIRERDSSLFYTMPYISGDEIPFNILHETNENMVCDYGFMLGNSPCYQYILKAYGKVSYYNGVKPKYILSTITVSLPQYKLQKGETSQSVVLYKVTNYTPFAYVENQDKEKTEIPLTIKNIGKDILSFSTNTSRSNGTITVLQNYYPGWHAKIDGKSVPLLSKKILKVNAQKGKHRYSFSYYSPLYEISAFISIISLLGWGTFILKRLRHTILQELSY